MAKLKVLGLIPARGGSKGIPGKNTRMLGGKPLLQYAWEAAQESGVIDRVLLSTDSEEIAEVGKRLGIEVPFIRPPELAQDDTPMLDVIEHLVEWLRTKNELPDAIALLQPTSPTRKAQHLIDAVAMLEQYECDSVVAVTEVPQHFAPHFVMKQTHAGYLDFYLDEGARITRRQDLPKAYSRCGTVYLFRLSSLEKYRSIYGEKCLPLVLPEEEAINLDTMSDWQEAERYFEKKA